MNCLGMHYFTKKPILQCSVVYCSVVYCSVVHTGEDGLWGIDIDIDIDLILI